MPVYNGAATLRCALDSMLAQRDVPAYEIVVVDDGSDDATPDILDEVSRRAACTQAHVEMKVSTTPHRGIVAALNHGLERCRGEYIARMDADDVSHPDRLRLQLEALEERPELAAVGCQVSLRLPEGADPGAHAGMQHYVEWANGLLTPEEIAAARFVESPVIHTSALIRTRVLRDEIGGYRTSPQPEDYDLWLRLIGRGDRVGKVARPLVEVGDGLDRVTRTDPRCSRAAFQRCRMHHLVRGPLADYDEALVWGAGTTGKQVLDDLREAGCPARVVADGNPRRHGHSIRGARVVSAETLAEYRAEHLPKAPVIVAVASRSGVDTIASWMADRGWREGRDAFFLAGTRPRPTISSEGRPIA